MSTAALKRELAVLRGSLAALTPSQSAALDDPIAWAERIAGLTLDPWQASALRFAPAAAQCDATDGKSTAAALKAAWTVLQGGLAVVVSPSLRQSGFLFRKLARHLVASEASFRRETHDRGRTGLRRVGGQPAGRPSRHAAGSIAAPRRPGGADQGGPRRVVGDDLANARRCAGGSTNIVVDPGGRQRRVSPRLDFGRRLGARADHCRSMSAHFR